MNTDRVIRKVRGHSGLWFVALLIALGALAVVNVVYAQTIPTISIVSVGADNTVTVQTHNFPPNQTFTVRMGKMGTRGVGGTAAGTLASGTGGSLTASFPIPQALRGDALVAIRLDSPAGYYSFNWFYNTTVSKTGGTTGGTTGGSVAGYSGIPTFSITGVEQDATVTIKAANFPPNRDFKVTMGAFGTRGVGGTAVTTTSSGAGGEFTATYAVPAALHGARQIAIRLESADGFYAFNWFYNSSTSAAATGGAQSTGTATGPVYVGYPTFTVQSVEKDATVTIVTSNLPPNRQFAVTMGAFGTRGVGGTAVATTESGAGGAQTLTYTIPNGLKGVDRIAIRMQSADGFFAYNWFYNSTATGAQTPPATSPPPSSPGPVVIGFPTFSVQAVQRDGTVTIATKNLPPNRQFAVTMGAFGTRGIGGYQVATTDSGAGGAQTLTYTIPAQLHGSYRIAIRLQSADGYYAFNWFFNSTTN